jgi:hypothetical protein
MATEVVVSMEHLQMSISSKPIFVIRRILQVQPQSKNLNEVQYETIALSIG